ncbi:hypothetical protein BJF93_17930 [Xaviernesmea oryzae]|uniref:Uncharacterized protein n=1 Tax=Xaviernesmea oryzae TaxID=464029 RepID=A0A1Q9ATY6_9HYPH|nr:DUF6656 family protein [Xaviernesmea oryzae]OLP58809.1 hypothetical protein BJF93_17930 [Xaviernesmea oryzae]SEK68866.1 hypothetical protein SAMN04487976_103295 [Xaviernesmea oryzae]
MSKIRYYVSGGRAGYLKAPRSAHSEFLRTGRIERVQRRKPTERRYISHDEAGARTARKLLAAADLTHERLNRFHPSIRLPKLVFHQIIEGRPHLGYCHVTAWRTAFEKFGPVSWSFYLANFFADIGDETHFFDHIAPGRSRMYFAVATKADQTGSRLLIDTSVHDDGILFRTSDPRVAMKNVLQMGTPSAALRAIIRAL